MPDFLVNMWQGISNVFFTTATPMEYLAFFAYLFGLIAIDILCHRSKEPMSAKNALLWTGFFIVAALAFNYLYILPTRGAETASLFLTGFMLEKVLALDNLMVFSAIFTAFKMKTVERAHLQMKVLYWGILGAVVFRLIFLGGGSFFVSIGHVDASTAAIVAIAVFIAYKYGLPAIENLSARLQVLIGACVFAILATMLSYDIGTLAYSAGYQVNSVMLIFAAFIGLTLVLPTWQGEEEEDEGDDFENHWFVNWLNNVFPVTKDIDSGKFFMNRTITTLFVVAALIELSDVMFAFDSMPVIIAVVQDPYIMICATMLAVAGLRSLYFVLDALMRTLWLLDKGVALVLGWITIKLVYVGFGGHIDHTISLSVVAVLLVGASVLSLIKKNPDAEDESKQSS